MFKFKIHVDTQSREKTLSLLAKLNHDFMMRMAVFLRNSALGGTLPSTG